MPPAIIPAVNSWPTVTPWAGGLAAEDRAEQDEQDRRQPEDERDRHLVPEERLDLDAAASQGELPGAGQFRGRAGLRARVGQLDALRHDCSSGSAAAGSAAAGSAAAMRSR